MNNAAAQAAQAAANQRINNTISDLPKSTVLEKLKMATVEVPRKFAANIKMATMATVEVPMKFAANINSSFSQLRERISRGQNVKSPQDPVQQTNAVCEGPGDNQMHNQGKHTCWYCNIPGHRQEECRKRIKDGKPCTGLNGSTYWPKPKQIPMDEEKEGEGKGESEIIQGAIGEMYTGHLANVFSGFQ